jgi:hypothetical protein
MRLCISALLAASLFCPLTAQTSDTPRGPDGNTQTYVAGIEVLPIPNQPFTGKDVIDWDRPTQGQGNIASHLEAKIVRDSQGRLYRERQPFTFPGATPPSHPTSFTIFDPIGHTRTLCEYSTHRCIISSYTPQFTFTAHPVGPFDHNRRFLERTSLGANTLNGLSVQGTRETITIQPGTIGNNQTMTFTSEFWYSPELQTNLLVTRNDPRQGTQTLHLADLLRGEPDPHSFDLPRGFVVVDSRRVTGIVH